MQEGQTINIPVKIVDKKWIMDKGEYLYTVQRPDGQFRRYYETKMQSLCQTKSLWRKLLSYFS